jgi:predicted metal-dependent TIM-barrel fold hydrolase
MYFHDSHLHLSSINEETLEEMYLAGIREITSPVVFGPARPGEGLSPETIIDLWDNQLNIQIDRAQKQFIKAYAMIGVSMVSTPKDNLERLLEFLPGYLKHPKVVAIGEIGFEPTSETCTDLKMQEKIVRAQLEIAKELGAVVDFHTPLPPDIKKEYTHKSLELCREYELPISQIIIDHCSEANIRIALDAGVYVAITVQPKRGITPRVAAELVKKYGAERVMINSDYSDERSYPLAVPQTALALKQKSVAEVDIEKVCWSNSRKVYRLS